MRRSPSPLSRLVCLVGLFHLSGPPVAAAEPAPPPQAPPPQRQVPSALAPPVEPGPVQPPDLVELVTLDPTIRLDIRYATDKNFIGRKVYDEARAFLQRPAALALVRAHQALWQKGYGLLIFDGYRPWSVTRLFWDLTPPDKRAFVADPKKGSRHNRGCAVDLSLYDRKTGREVAMPSDYDEASPRAAPDYADGPAAARVNRDRLRAALAEVGFTVEPNEWWHHNFRDCPHYAILDVPFRDVPPAPPGKGKAAPPRSP